MTVALNFQRKFSCFFSSLLLRTDCSFASRLDCLSLACWKCWTNVLFIAINKLIERILQINFDFQLVHYNTRYRFPWSAHFSSEAVYVTVFFPSAWTKIICNLYSFEWCCCSFVSFQLLLSKCCELARQKKMSGFIQRKEMNYGKIYSPGTNGCDELFGFNFEVTVLVISANFSSHSSNAFFEKGRDD